MHLQPTHFLVMGKKSCQGKSFLPGPVRAREGHQSKDLVEVRQKNHFSTHSEETFDKILAGKKSHKRSTPLKWVAGNFFFPLEKNAKFFYFLGHCFFS